MNSKTKKKIFKTKVISGGKTTIPAEIRRKLKIREGDYVLWTIHEDGTITVASAGSERYFRIL